MRWEPTKIDYINYILCKCPEYKRKEGRLFSMKKEKLEKLYIKIKKLLGDENGISL